MCSDLETYNKFEILLEYYMISSINLTDMEFKRIGMISMWGNVITAFTDITNAFMVYINENAPVAKVSVTIEVLKTIFSHEINRIKQMFYDKEMMITVNDNVSREIIYVKRTRELPSELKNDSVKLRNILYRHTMHQEFFLLQLLSSQYINENSQDIL